METMQTASVDGVKHAPYAEVNATWPESMPVPSGAEAIAGARLLIREGFRFHENMTEAKRKRKFKLVSGNRRTWPRRGVWNVNPNGCHFGGWKEIVHSISHYVHWRVMPGRRPHDMHALTERHLIDYVIKSGWLDGKLKRAEKPKPERDLRGERATRIAERIKRWEAKQRRAETALRKLRRQMKRYAN